MPEWEFILSLTCQPEMINLKDGVTAGHLFAGTGKHADGTAAVAKGLTICTTFILIPNGDLTGGIGTPSNPQDRLVLMWCGVATIRGAELARVSDRIDPQPSANILPLKLRKPTPPGSSR